MHKHSSAGIREWFHLSWRDTAYAAVILAATTFICIVLNSIDNGSAFAPMLFVLAVMVISRVTDGYFYGTVASFLGMFLVNYIFTYPYFAFNFSISGYPLTFITMLAVSITTSTMTTQVKQQEKIKAAVEQEKIRSNLLRAVSHDIRTPLTSILGASSALLENESAISPERREELLLGVRDEAEWLIRMVENMLSVTRFQDGAAKLHKRAEAVEEVVAGAVQKFRKRFSKLPVRVSVPEELLLVPMDPILIEQVIVNLLENAAKHSETATHILLSVRKEGEYAMFEVYDDGRGIPREQMHRLFTGYFQRAEQAGDTGRNMGIGLAVCKAVIQAHDGKMEAENGPKQGITFRFWLPISELEPGEG